MTNLIADSKLAIELEQKGYDFYKGAAEKTNHPLAKATLESLAERELLHLARVKELYLQLTGEKNLPADWLNAAAVAPSKGALLKPILLRLKQSLKQEFKNTEDINAAYRIAEDMERDSYTLYEKIAHETADPTARQFYAALAKEEQEHFEILSDTLLYLNQPGDWFKKEERWIVDGG